MNAIARYAQDTAGYHSLTGQVGSTGTGIAMASWVNNLLDWFKGTRPDPACDDATPPAGVTAPTGLPIIDDDRFAELHSLGDPMLVRHVIQTFFSGVPPQLETLRKALVDGDHSGIRGVSHTLKGGSASAGFPRASEAAAALEDAARESDSGAYAGLIAELETTLELTRTAAQAHLS